MIRPARRFAAFLFAAFLTAIALPAPCAAENIVFPTDAGVVNVRGLGARGDGTADDTAAIQKALDGAARLVYLPNGTYLISDTLRWGGTGGGAQKRIILQGQSQNGTVIRLKDGCAGYTDPAKPRSMIWTGEAPAQRFRNAIRNLTVHSGKNNPGAIAVQYIANNQGTLREVTIRSGDGRGVIGLDLGYTNEQGPCLIKNVNVTGFDTGISAKHAVDSITFQNIVLKGQNKYGIYNDGQCISIEGLTSDTAGPAVYSAGETGLVTLIGGKLQGKRGAQGAAIVNEAALYARDVRTPGYPAAIRSTGGTGKGVTGGNVTEFVSHETESLFPSPARALRLPIKETPQVPWDDLTEWASPTHFGAAPNDDKDDTEAIQKAIDSGKTTLYFPVGTYMVNGSVTVRGNIRRILGLESKLAGDGRFQFVAGASPVVVFERFDLLYSTVKLEQATSRTLVIGSVTFGGGYEAPAGAGDLFLEDVCGAPWIFKRQNVWARQFNTEGRETKIVNDGGSLWIMGYKTEATGTLIETRGGGRTEVLGGFSYSNSGNYTMPMFVNDNSSLSVTIGESNYNGTPWQILVRETRGSETRELKRDGVPRRGNASMLPLYTGHRERAKPSPPR
jgi:hypothetical protein